MNPLSALYNAATQTRNGFYDRGVLSSRRLRGPVVSIGNISAGGSGKTPFLMAFGALLQQRGISFDVLSRGYKRRSKGIALVDPDGSPRDFGDEPLLIARKLNVSVIVGEDRYAAGRFAEEHFGARLHLLDDGFQHRGLARDFDIVLVNASDPGDTLLPRGRLREPLSSLSRADAIVLTNEASADGLPLTQQRCWRVRRGIDPPTVEAPCIAFCGIARPHAFFSQLRDRGVTLANTRVFRDHHAYSEADVRGLLTLQRKGGGTAFITTEKDAINLEAVKTELAPLHVVPVRMEIENASVVVETVLQAIRARNPRFA